MYYFISVAKDYEYDLEYGWIFSSTSPPKDGKVELYCEFMPNPDWGTVDVKYLLEITEDDYNLLATISNLGYDVGNMITQVIKCRREDGSND